MPKAFGEIFSNAYEDKAATRTRSGRHVEAGTILEKF